MVAFDIDSIPDRDKALNSWAVWKTENGSKKRVSYGRWKSFYEAVLLLVRYPEFEGLSFISSLDLDSTGPGYHNTETKIVFIKYYKIINLKAFLKSEKSRIRGGCQ